MKKKTNKHAHLLFGEFAFGLQHGFWKQLPGQKEKNGSRIAGNDRDSTKCACAFVHVRLHNTSSAWEVYRRHRLFWRWSVDDVTTLTHTSRSHRYTRVYGNVAVVQQVGIEYLFSALCECACVLVNACVRACLYVCVRTCECARYVCVCVGL